MIQPLKARGVYMWANYQKIVDIPTPALVQLESDQLGAQKTVANSSGIIKTIAEAWVKTLTADQEQLMANGNAFTKGPLLVSSKPVVLGGITRLDVSWVHTIGNRQGLKANFLQPWYNKPVSITIEGQSYMGAFGGSTVSNTINEAYGAATTPSPWSKATNVVNQAQQWMQDKLNYITKQLGSKSYQTVGPFEDGTIGYMQDLISFFDHGPTASSDTTATNIEIQLLIENEPSGSNPTPFAVFTGYVEDFRYTEEVSQPFMHHYTIKYVGESTAKASLSGGTLTAQKEMAKMGITTAIAPGSQAYTLFTMG